MPCKRGTKTPWKPKKLSPEKPSPSFSTALFAAPLSTSVPHPLPPCQEVYAAKVVWRSQSIDLALLQYAGAQPHHCTCLPLFRDDLFIYLTFRFLNEELCAITSHGRLATQETPSGAAAQNAF